MIMAEGNQNPVEEILEMETQLDHDGGYIFISDHLNMQESFRRQMFGLDHNYRDSVMAITPGTPLFLYESDGHRLHGIFVATSQGGMNLDSSAWPNKIFPGSSLCPAQVRVKRFRICPYLTGKMFRPLIGDCFRDGKCLIRVTAPQIENIFEVFEVNRRVCTTISRLGLDNIIRP